MSSRIELEESNGMNSHNRRESKWFIWGFVLRLVQHKYARCSANSHNLCTNNGATHGTPGFLWRSLRTQHLLSILAGRMFQTNAKQPLFTSLSTSHSHSLSSPSFLFISLHTSLGQRSLLFFPSLLLEFTDQE